MQIQHGDVLLKEIESLPGGVKKTRRENGRLIVMKGETTGHAHVITDQAASIWMLEKDGKTELYLEATEPVTIIHEEHKPLPIPAGIYRIGQVSEYDYFREMERKAID
jgi:hypothetical protein